MSDMPDRGIAPTPEHARLIERAIEVIESDRGINAAWLGGSLASGIADQFSDIDLHCVISDDSAGWFAAHWTDLARRISPYVLATPLPDVIGGYVITPQWLHFDVLLHPQTEFEKRPAKLMRPLYDPDGILAAKSAPRADLHGPPYFPADRVELYFYLLGNLAAALGRGELLVATSGAIARRDVGLVPVLLAENGVRKSDGHKRLNQHLTDDQRTFLESLPPLVAERDAVIEFDRRVAAELIRRGRTLASATGAEWPAALEAATVSHLRRSLGAAFGG